MPRLVTRKRARYQSHDGRGTTPYANWGRPPPHEVSSDVWFFDLPGWLP
jgi:hypothetical protein